MYWWIVSNFFKFFLMSEMVTPYRVYFKQNWLRIGCLYCFFIQFVKNNFITNEFEKIKIGKYSNDNNLILCFYSAPCYNLVHEHGHLNVFNKCAINTLKQQRFCASFQIVHHFNYLFMFSFWSCWLRILFNNIFSCNMFATFWLNNMTICCETPYKALKTV